MEDIDQNSAQGMFVEGSSRLKQKAQQKESKPVRISFQKRVSRQNKVARNSTLKPLAFTKANWQLALKNNQKIRNRFYKGEELGMMTDVQHFKIYGPGVSLFFEFQKYLILAFLLMSIVSLGPTIFNYISGTKIVGQGSSLAYYFGGTTIGNFQAAKSNYSTSYKWVNSISDMVVIFIFIVFYFFWLKKGSALTQEIKTMIKLKSYNVIELIEFAQGVTVEEVAQFMGRFGSVAQVAAVKNYSQTISLSKKIYDLQIEMKQLEIKKQQEKTTQFDQNIAEIKQTIEQTFKQLMIYEDNQSQEIIKFYVNFRTVEDRQNALKQIEKYNRALFDCCDTTPREFLLKGERVTVKACHTQPTDILWENQHVNWSTRWLRVVIQYILLLVALAIGFLIISFLNILVPASTSSISTSQYTSTTILSVANTTIIQSWCITNQISVLQAGSSSTIYNFCRSYIFQYLLKIIITIGISVSVVVIKFILKKFILFLARFKRYKTQSEQSRDMVFNLFLAYLATTVMITFLLQAFIFGISFKDIIRQLISNDYLLKNSNTLIQYKDFVSAWYVQIGYQLSFNVLTMAIHPAISMPFILFLLEKYTFWKASKQEVQGNMQKAIQPAQFQIQSNYADLLVIIFTGLAFSGGIPALTIICFITITSRYFYFKYLFYRHCKIPKTFDEALDNQIVNIIPFAIFIHFAFAIWMYGVTEIFKADKDFDIYLGNSRFMQNLNFIFQRIFDSYYYSAFFAVYLIVWVFKTVLYNFLIKLLVGGQKKEVIVPIKIEVSQYTGGEFAQTAVSSKALCDSYKIQNNPDYVEVLQIMKKKKKFIVKIKHVEE